VLFAERSPVKERLYERRLGVRPLNSGCYDDAADWRLSWDLSEKPRIALVPGLQVSFFGAGTESRAAAILKSEDLAP